MNIRAKISAWRALATIPKLMRQWRRLATEATPTKNVNTIKRLVIAPSDPWTLTGAKGDEAMMQAMVDRFRTVEPQLEVGILTGSPVADKAAREMGFIPLPWWTEPWTLEAITLQLREYNPDALIVLGADVMDGYYSPVTTMRLLATADVMSRHGVRSAILGFSFNEQPNPRVKQAFDELNPLLAINVRDRISLRRYRTFTPTPARLVADCAFMLRPTVDSSNVATVRNWATARRQTGDKVIAFNVHPMLIKGATDRDIEALVQSSSEALQNIMTGHRLSVVLLSHDYRGRDGDDTCLQPLHASLAPSFGDRVHYPSERMSAAELKAIAGLMDGVVTGRMHLAIASLGMGVPVAALTYQDKFHGLFDHFELPADLLLTPSEALDARELTAMLHRFVLAMPNLQRQVQSRWPTVLEASERNLKGLLDAPAPIGQALELHTAP